MGLVASFSGAVARLNRRLTRVAAATSVEQSPTQSDPQAVQLATAEFFEEPAVGEDAETKDQG
jgi:hypothetical protein